MPAAKPERGLIRTVDSQKIKGKDYTPRRIEVPFLFNPAEISVTKANQWKTPNSGRHRTNKTLEFGGGQPRQITLELFFDTYEIHHDRQLRGRHPDVREYTDKLIEMMQVQPNLGGAQDGGWPPQVVVEWGTLQRGWRIFCYITNMSQKFLLFLPDGTPVRATVQLTLVQSDDTVLGPQNPSSLGEGNERTRLVQPCERLDLIAHEEYGDSTLWRLIADANGLRAITDLRVGQRLAIPPLN